MNDDLVERLRTRAAIRRKIREAEGPHEDRIANLCDEAADRIEYYEKTLSNLNSELEFPWSFDE